MSSRTILPEMSIELKSQLVEMRENYTEVIKETLEFLRDSKDYLEFKRMKEYISLFTYSVRIKSLISMAIVYFYSLYEAYIRSFFAKVLYLKEGVEHKEFDSRFSNFHDIITKVMKKKYQIYLPKSIFLVIDDLRIARNYIVHLGKKSKPEFGIIEKCSQAIVQSFVFIERKMFKKHL